ncbi:Peptide methionine sulfoxide reductase MsrA [Commensalibacter sp. Nvir]|uniref:peptide-methionine (S)-S-oxide reductase MsrA n=1 Tax=Commensalibacter sp. Nvir TaxID=3069817 RepID=UPI002D667AC0|nr:Peptide methionine sulfoxide reductase MsrA [Commensalibacter sp. Nvir]
MVQPDEINKKLETIVLGGGCFWCLEAVYKNFKFICKIEPGYAGGHFVSPTYEEVCKGQTGHAEVVRITFDSSSISLEEMLYIFFLIHDPTTVNAQGMDIGSQYRSIILPSTLDQMKRAFAVKKKIEEEKIWSLPIVTEFKMLEQFYPAEFEHQNYYELHHEAAYCRAVIAPKVLNARKKFFRFLKN